MRKALSENLRKTNPCVKHGMGFLSLGACSFTKCFVLQFYDRFAFPALDGDQVSDHFVGFSPAGAGNFGKDTVCFLIQNDAAGEPATAVALKIIGHQVQRRPGHLSQFPPILGASALVHGALSFDRNSCNFALVMQRQKPLPAFRCLFFWFFYFLMVLINWEMAEMARRSVWTVDQIRRTRFLKRVPSQTI